MDQGESQARDSHGSGHSDAVGGNLARVLSNITLGVAVCRRGGIVWANPALARLCAVGEAAELRGKPVESLWRDVGGGLPAADADRPTEVEVRRSDGERVRARVRCVRTAPCPGSGAQGGGTRETRGPHETREEDPALTPFESGDDMQATEIWWAEDVTTLASREAELMRVHRDLHAAHQEIAALRGRLAMEAEEREHLLGVVSHELRTPVTVISGYSRLLLAGEVGEVNEEQRRFLAECHKSCNRLDEFIGKLLSASRVMRGEEELELDRAPVEPTIRSVLGMLRPLVEERGIRVEVELDPAAGEALFDAARIEQVLTNLLGNAIRYAGDGGRVRVAVRPLRAAGRAFVEIAVCDDGPGVPFELRQRIFEPYVRGPNGRNDGGLGLGLAICKRLVEAHGGSITVTDADGGGSRFAFSLPAAEGPFHGTAGGDGR